MFTFVFTRRRYIINGIHYFVSEVHIEYLYLQEKRRGMSYFLTVYIQDTEKIVLPSRYSFKEFGIYLKFSERRGFEPLVRLLVRFISNEVLSATQSSLHSQCTIVYIVKQGFPQGIFFHALQDSNLRHQVLETCVLPTELRTHNNMLIYYFCKTVRSDRIRTCDHIVPNDVRYQTALHSDMFYVLEQQMCAI